MERIVVAGAGHGGLVATAKLAKAGYDVTVFEKGVVDDLGHDWEDRFTFDILKKIVEKDELPEGSFRFRGDCAFVSPSHRTHVQIAYTEQNRQKLMWRKTVLSELVAYAKKCGVKFCAQTEVVEPLLENGKVVGIKTSAGDESAELVIDACGVLSPLRAALAQKLGTSEKLARGDVFYSYRAYFNKTADVNPDFPFEVYMYHECEQGLSWFCTNPDNVDVLIGRIDPLSQQKVGEQLEIFRKNHSWLGTEILHGGSYSAIPVRRPLALLATDGYVAIGDSAFMTTPMNGMGIDLSLLAGKLLAETIIGNGNTGIDTLWSFNRKFHVVYGGDTAKNEGLKNAILKLPPEGVDFLFDNRVIQSSDLAGAGRNVNAKSLIGKFVRGMKNPKYFFALVSGLIKGAKACRLYKNPPEAYELEKIRKWAMQIESTCISLNRAE